MAKSQLLVKQMSPKHYINRYKEKQILKNCQANMFSNTVEPLQSGHRGAEESGRRREVQTRVNVWTVRQKKWPL